MSVITNSDKAIEKSYRKHDISGEWKVSINDNYTEDAMNWEVRGYLYHWEGYTYWRRLRRRKSVGWVLKYWDTLGINLFSDSRFDRFIRACTEVIHDHERREYYDRELEEVTHRG